MYFISLIGIITVLLGATLALAQRDINYSKIVNNQAMLHKTRIITRKWIPIY